MDVEVSPLRTFCVILLSLSEYVTCPCPHSVGPDHLYWTNPLLFNARLLSCSSAKQGRYTKSIVIVHDHLRGAGPIVGSSFRSRKILWRQKGDEIPIMLAGTHFANVTSNKVREHEKVGPLRVIFSWSRRS